MNVSALAMQVANECGFDLGDTLERIFHADDTAADNDFVDVFKRAIQLANSDCAITDSNPWGDEHGPYLLPGNVVQEYSSLCSSKTPVPNMFTDEMYMQHVEWLQRVVPGSLKKATMEEALGTNGERVIQFFLTMVDTILDDSDDEESEEEEGEEEEEEEDVEPEEEEFPTLD